MGQYQPILDACCGSKMFWFDKENINTKYDSEDYSINENLYSEVKEDSEKHVEEIRLNFDDAIYDEQSVKREQKLIHAVGLALGTFLIAEDEDTMYIFDIHAADERANYEKIVDAINSKKVYTTKMLIPLNLEYSHNEFMNIKENLNEIIDLGFEVE